MGRRGGTGLAFQLKLCTLLGEREFLRGGARKFAPPQQSTKLQMKCRARGPRAPPLCRAWGTPPLPPFCARNLWGEGGSTGPAFHLKLCALSGKDEFPRPGARKFAPPQQSTKLQMKCRARGPRAPPLCRAWGTAHLPSSCARNLWGEWGPRALRFI